MILIRNRKIDDAYRNLLEKLKKNNKCNEDYNPKNYSFSLDSFDEEGNEKKIENQRPSI